MTDRDRLIEIIYCAGRDYDDYVDCQHEMGMSAHEDFDEWLADELLAKGFILLPCKVGQTVYVPWYWDGEFGIASAEIEEINIYDSKNHCMFFIDLQSDDEEYNQSFGGWKTDQSIGKSVFLTQEEAEQALKEREKDAR